MTRTGRGWMRRAAGAVLVHPSLWGTAAREVTRMARRGWWKQRPFLPVPDRDYLRFRLVTMYGDPAHEPEPDDLVAYLRWCRRFEGVRR